MWVIGIVGGVASGKSLVSQNFARRGAEVIEGDRLGHEVLQEPEVITALRARWGDKILSASGEIDRRAVAQIVFAPTPTGKADLQFLESVTHPRISAKMRDKISELATQGAVDIVVLDAALLLEAGWDEYCDKILYVDTPELVRHARAAARGWTSEEVAQREAAQLPLDQKKNRADLVIDNSQSPAETARQVETIIQTLAAAE
jgi:dephospho-CoA kinase